jgi:TPR repeat protein
MIMKAKTFAGFFLSFGIAALAQNAELRGTLAQGFSDFGAIKIQAEQGDVAAQVKLADAYLSNFKSADALEWYKTAAPKSLEAQYQCGNLLLFGRPGIPQDKKIAPNPAEGLKWTYSAAINGHKQAWRNLAKARQSGIGCSTNLVEAYAWLSLLAETGDIVGRVEMNNLALKLSSDEIRRGKSIQQNMQAGHWPQLVILKSSQPDLGLKLNGLIPSGANPMAAINGKTLAEGETANIKLKKGTVNVKCLKINKDSVLILVDGEEEPRLLLMQ